MYDLVTGTIARVSVIKKAGIQRSLTIMVRAQISNWPYAPASIPENLRGKRVVLVIRKADDTENVLAVGVGRLESSPNGSVRLRLFDATDHIEPGNARTMKGVITLTCAPYELVYPEH